jgi:hypothetical protein
MYSVAYGDERKFGGVSRQIKASGPFTQPQDIYLSAVFIDFASQNQ